MSAKLSWFTVRLALLGVPGQYADEAVRDLQNELEMRPHLRNPQISWKSETRQAIIQVDNEALSPESAAEGMAEELLEVAVAVLKEFKRIRVEILDVRPSSENDHMKW